MTNDHMDALEAAIGRMESKLNAGAQLKALRESLLPGERVAEVAGARFRAGNGLLVVSDRRVFSFRRGTSGLHVNSVSLEGLSDIHADKGLVSAKVTAVGVEGRVKVASMIKADAARCAEAARREYLAARDRAA